MQKIKDLIYYNRKEIITILICFTIFISFLFFNNAHSDEVIEQLYTKDEVEDKEEQNEKIIIDIKGEVNSPGTYELTTNNRIIDAVEKAGGFTKNADTSTINLSEKLTDEMLIIIPNMEEMNDENNNQIINKKNSGVIKKDNSTSKSINENTNDSKISINNASANELMKINGIGEKKAKAIVEYREKNGLFKSIDEITKVSGIGNSIFEKIKDFIKV